MKAEAAAADADDGLGEVDGLHEGESRREVYFDFILLGADDGDDEGDGRRSRGRSRRPREPVVQLRGGHP